MPMSSYGISLNNGVFSGTPTISGDRYFTYIVTDARGKSTSWSLRFIIEPIDSPLLTTGQSWVCEVSGLYTAYAFSGFEALGTKYYETVLSLVTGDTIKFVSSQSKLEVFQNNALIGSNTPPSGQQYIAVPRLRIKWAG